MGWLRLGTNLFVRWKELAICSLSVDLRAFSRAGRSSVSSSLMCLLRSSIRDLRLGVKSGLLGPRFWKV
jgi:hypothetical protein